MKKYLRTYSLMTLGALIAASAISLFLVPNQLAVGGVSGLATVLYYVTKIPVGIIALCVNIPIFLVGILIEGKKFGLKSLYAMILFSVFIDLLNVFSPITLDPFLASVFGGMILGTGLALVFIAGATTGGTDIVAKLMQRAFRHIPIGRLILFSDLAIILFATIVFRNMEIGLYSIVSLLVSTFVIDKVIDGGKSGKTVYIISKNAQEISARVLAELHRGVTGLKGMGMYSNEEKTVLMCTVRGRQIPILKDIVRRSDPNAFMTLADVREVAGEGFEEI